MPVATWLDSVQTALTLAIAVATLVTIVVSRLALSWVVLGSYARHTAPVMNRRWRQVIRGLRPGVTARLTGGDWSVSDEYLSLGGIAASGRPIEWGDPELLRHLSEKYGEIGASLRRSFLLRFGAGADITREEAGFCERCAQALLRDADHREQVVGARRRAPSLTALLNELGIRVMLWPPGTELDGYYREARCSMTGEHFGAPNLPFSALSQDTHEGSWGAADADLRRTIDEAVVAAAQNRVEHRPQDFNGRLVRLRTWRTEIADSSLGMRIHVLADQTNYASFLATNGGFRILKDNERWRRQVRELCLDRYYEEEKEDWAPELSMTANPLLLHLSLVTADQKLVLVRRGWVSELYQGRLSTAVNGAVEVGERQGLQFADYDDNGFVDVGRTALREAGEEIGDHLNLRRENFVVRALALSVDPDIEVTPFICLENRTQLTLSELAAGHFANASRHEGAFEIGGLVVGLPMHKDTARKAIAWLAKHRSEITGGGLLTSMLAFGYFLSSEEMVDAWHSSDALDEDAVEKHAV